MGMTNLWKAVVAQAMHDHTRGIDTDYISLDNQDFLTVCDLAGLSPHGVIERLFYMKHKI